MSGDQHMTVAVGQFHGGRIAYGAAIDEAAEECGLSPFMLPGGKGFAINFRNVFAMQPIALSAESGGRKRIIWPLFEKPPLDKLDHFHLWDRAPADSDTAVIFEKAVLTVPYSVDVLRELSRTPVRSPPRRRLQRPGPGTII